METGLAGRERRALCDLLDQVGPDAPTLCTGWTTRDLAAHLVIRETRPDAALGIALPRLAGYTAWVQRGVARKPWPELVEQVRGGPPWWSPTRRPGLADRIDGAEFFVHHEDVRRARPGWQPRAADPRRAAQLWALLSRLGRLCYRRSPVGVVLRRPDGSRRTVHPGERAVTVVGPPEELMLHAYGRDEVLVNLEGSPRDIADLEGCQRGL